MLVYEKIHLTIKHEDMTGYFMRKYEVLYDFYITLEEELTYELNPCEEYVEWARSDWTYKICNGNHNV